MKKTITRSLLAILFVVIGFSIAKLKVFPYKFIEKSFKMIFSFSADEPEYETIKDELILSSLFKDPIIKKNNFIYDKINSIDELYETLNKEIIYEDSLELIYDKIVVLSDSSFLVYDTTECISIKYKYEDQVRTAYSFKKGSNKEKACLIIPGSGNNQSSEIVLEQKSNYHNGFQSLLLEKDYSTYTYIKPNEDILAYHNGTKKLNQVGYVNWYLNQGSSYSLGYIVHTIAYVKYLKQNYDFTLVAGLSQGGLASLVNSIVSEPDLAIVSSGYSILYDKLEPSGHNQLIIPNISSLTQSNKMLEKLKMSKTNYIFTYGKSESSIYKVEALDSLTFKFFNLPNASFIIHDGGHVFPLNELKNYLN